MHNFMTIEMILFPVYNVLNFSEQTLPLNLVYITVLYTHNTFSYIMFDLSINIHRCIKFRCIKYLTFESGSYIVSPTIFSKYILKKVFIC